MEAAKDFSGMPSLEKTTDAQRKAETSKMFADAFKNKGMVSMDDTSDEEDDKNDLNKSNNSTSAPVPISEYTELEELDW